MWYLRLQWKVRGGGITLQPGRRLGNTIPPENISMQNWNKWQREWIAVMTLTLTYVCRLDLDPNMQIHISLCICSLSKYSTILNSWIPTKKSQTVQTQIRSSRRKKTFAVFYYHHHSCISRIIRIHILCESSASRCFTWKAFLGFF